MKKLSSFLLPLTIAFLINGIIACTSHMQKYRGKMIDPDSRIDLLEEGSQEGIWQPFDLRLEYQYERSDNILLLSGNVQLSQFYSDIYPYLKNFYLYLFFINKEGKILDNKRIVNAISSDVNDRFPFKQKLTIPSNTVYISFGYDGQVGSLSGGDFFSNYPWN